MIHTDRDENSRKRSLQLPVTIYQQQAARFSL